MGVSSRTASGSERTGQGMPEGAEALEQVARRRRRGRVWLALFQAALIVAVLALVALLLNILNGTIGLAAVQTKADPAALGNRAQQYRTIALPNTTATEDDTVIAAGVAADPNAAGFFGYAHYAAAQDELKVIAVDGVLPSAATVESGEYPLSRPIYFYVNRRALANKPQTAAFLYYALTRADGLLDELGYFAAPEDAVAASTATLLEYNEEAASVTAEGAIRLAGSSTVFPLAQRLADDFAAGTNVTITIDNTGTNAGFVRLCQEQDVDIVGASRPLTLRETAACEEEGIVPVELRIGTDAIVVVASAANEFLSGIDSAQAQALFGSATTWDEVNPEYPAEAIVRYVPGLDSATLELFTEAVFDTQLADLNNQELVLLLRESLSSGVYRRYEAETPFAERSQAGLLGLIEERVIEPTVLASWDLSTSLLNREEIEGMVQAKYPAATLQWWRWLDRSFLTSAQSSVPEAAGVRTALLGSLWVILITMLVAVPVGLGAAIYLEEYAGHSRLHQIVQTNIDNLAGVPSIIYGILGLTVFVRVMEPITSGAAMGIGDAGTANGRTILSAALTLALLVLPVIIINAQEAIRAVPRSLREAGYGLGATKWQVTWTHVLSNALPGIFTGTILAMSRALGETAPLIVVGASTFITTDPTGPFAKFTVLPMQIYQWTSRPQDEFRHIAASASVVLIVLLLLLNGTAIWLRNRYGKKL